MCDAGVRMLGWLVVGRKWEVRSTFLTLLSLAVSVRADELTAQDLTNIYRSVCVCVESGVKIVER